MPAAVVPISNQRHGYWSLLEIAPPGQTPVPYGILLADDETRGLTQRLRGAAGLENLEEQALDILDALPADLAGKALESGAFRLLDGLEDSLSGFFRISDRSSIAYNDARGAVDRLFDEHVLHARTLHEIDEPVRPFTTHLPVYSLRAAATRFGEGIDAEQSGWVRPPGGLRLQEGMFVAQVVGRSMEPLIPDGSACVFRAPVTGSRGGRYLLIEQLGETDFDARYTVKRYARRGPRDESAEREAPIRLEPVNREFEAFELTSDEFRVVAEFVQVLPS